MEALINFKVIVLGSQGVGKSSLIMRYIKGEFSENYNVTVGVEFFTKIVQVQPGRHVRIQIWDTAGQQFFRSLVRSFYQGICAVFLVYSIDNVKSFNELKSWANEVRENSHQEVVFFLIGARADCEENRQVQSNLATDYVKQIHGAFYIETSAKTGMGIDLLFKKAADYMYKKYTADTSFRELVQPIQADNNQNMLRNTRGPSLILKRQTVMEESRRKQKQGCCN